MARGLWRGPLSRHLQVVLTLLAAYWIGQGCPPPGGDPNKPEVVNPPANAVVTTSKAYVSVKVLTGQTYEVWLTPQGQASQQVTSQFRFAATFSGTKEIHHAQLAVPLGTHQVRVTQHVSGGSSVLSLVRTFSRAEGATRELGPLDDAGGAVVGTALQGALRRAAGSIWLLFGETRLADATVHPAAQASSADANAADGIDLTYYGEPGAIQSALPLAPAAPGENDEEGVVLTASFERGGDVYAYYLRIDAEATPFVQGVGLARAVGGAPPFTRLSFPGAQPPGGGHFDDDYSLFQANELPLLRGAFLSGNEVLLLGQRAGASGLPQDAEAVLVKAPLSSVEDRATYQFWTEVGGVRAWRAASSGIVPLFKNASPPSLHWNPQISRFVAVSTQEYGEILPYTGSAPRSAIQLRVADDPVGPWSAPIAVWGLPPVAAGAVGMVLGAMQLPGFESGSLLYVAATDASDPLLPTKAQLFEVDLNDLALPVGPVPPQITTATGNTSDDPTTVRGWATPGDTVALVVNGTNQASVTAGAGGEFAIPAILLDGANTVHAFATRSSQTSAPSNTITLTYQNDDNRSVSGTISANTVWTPGTPATPYSASGQLTVNPGVYLVLQPGVKIEFQSGASILVKGELRIQGTSAAPVKLGPNGVVDPLTCSTPGVWAGLDVNNSAVGGTGAATIAYARIGCAARGIDVIGDAATIRDTTIYNSQTLGISVTSGGAATIERVVIDRATNGGSAGIEINEATSVTVTDSTVRRSGDGIRVTESSPTIAGNLLELNTNGLRIQRLSNPEVTGNTIRSNATGVSVEGNFSLPQDPDPSITGNDIHSNTSTNLAVSLFYDKLRLVDVAANWWGSTDPVAIASKISDASDPTGNNPPFAGFAPWLGAGAFVGGAPVLGNYLNGPATGALVPGSPYEVVGKVLVSDGPLGGLTVQAGSELRFYAGTALEAKGPLLVAGTAGAPVQLRSAKAVPAVGDWEGIRIVGAGAAGSLVEHAIVDHGFVGIEIEDTWATVRDSTIREFGRPGGGGVVGAGIRIDGESAVATDPKAIVRGNVLTKDLGGSETEYGVHVLQASPAVEENTIRNANEGLRIQGPGGVGSTPITPAVAGNDIEENQTGIRIDGHADPSITGNRIVGNSQYGFTVIGLFDAARDPRPAVHENEIHGSGFDDVSASNFGNAAGSVLDFERNWWGTTDLAAIALQINDQSDSQNGPVVDFAPPLDGPGGSPLPGQYLAGPTAPGTVLAAGTYQVVGALSVPAGETLVVQGGARLEFLPGAAFKVQGVLDVQGGPANLATFTAAGATPTPGSWDGVVLEATADGSTLDYARIEYATRGLDIRAEDVVVTNSEFGEVPVSGWAIYANAVASGLVAGNTFDNAASGTGTAIELLVATLAIDANTVTGFHTGIWLTQSNAVVTENVIQGQDLYGIRIGYLSAPSVTNDNLITANGTGIILWGSNNASQNPNPTIQGNRILGNTAFNLSSQFFGNPATTTVAATLNYWGSENPGTIGAGIWDRTDAGSQNAPTIAFTPFLDANLQPVSGSYLNGTLGSDLTIATGTTWDVVGDLTVPASRTLTVEAGATLRFAANTALLVQGTLDVNGTASQKAVFTSAPSSPPQSTWDGIRITAGTSTLDHARVEFADRAIDVRNAAATVRNCEVYDFGRYQIPGFGIYFESATGTIEDNQVEHRGSHSTFATTGIRLYGAAPTVDGNTVESLDVGLSIEGLTSASPVTPAVTANLVQSNGTGIEVRQNANPSITGANVVTANQNGISIVGGFVSARDPAPVIHGNDLAGNGLSDLATSGYGDVDGPAIDAEENWWGYTTIQAVADRIVDESEYSRPVDFAPFLDASVGNGGMPVAGSFLVGPLSVGTIAAGTHEVTGRLLVPAGQTVTLQAGAQLEFADGTVFEVEGTLQAQGTAGNPVLLTSLAGSGPGDWKGIVVRPPSTGSSFSHTRIENARTGIDVRGATNISVADSEIEFFDDYGVFLFDGAGGTIDETLIRNGSDLGTGIFLQESSPSLTGNEIRDNEIGIEIQWGSNPTIEDGNTITSNRYGIRIAGGHYSLAASNPNPAPIIHGNSIFGNRPNGSPVDANLHVFDFWYPGTNERIDASGNWWGTQVAAEIRATFKLDDKPPTVVDYSNFLNGAGGQPVGGARFSNTLANVRHSTTRFRPAFAEGVAVDFDLLAPGSVDFVVYPEDDATLSTPLYTSTVAFDAGPRTFTWDGRKNDGTYLDDGAYRYVLRGDGGSSGNYDPFIPDLPQLGSIQAGAQTPTFNAFRNELWKRPVTVSDASRRLALRIQPEGKPSFLLFDRVCYAPSPTPYDVTWNGIDPNGQPVVGPVLLNILDLNRNVTPNHFVLYDVGPKVTGPTSVPAPTIEVRSSPALVYHSYDQFTRITYKLDRPATVTVELLPPGVTDPNAPSAIVLLSNQSQAAGEHTATWLGHNAVDTNEILAGAEGPYTFVIQATGASTAKTTTTRGVLTLRR